MTTPIKNCIFFAACLFAMASSNSQPITGVWKGSTGKGKVELKLIKSGDSLTGTAYYYSSSSNYRRYSIKGYFDPKTNETIWWDDILIEDRSSHTPLSENSFAPLMTIADFNCPGEDVMRLDGNSFLRDEKKKKPGSLNVEKKKATLFPDQWDWVIANYTVGANDPYIIDSIEKLSLNPKPVAAPQRPSRSFASPKKSEPLVTNTLFTRPAPTEEKKEIAAPKQTPEEKFASRKNILEQVIPVKGDSIELRFYDNGEIDGDSIAFFMNSKLIFKHVMITDRAYSVKFAVKDLEQDNEAVMVAENLGSIPPNTALMIALVGDKQYEAHLYADENSSAMIRFVKEDKFTPAVK